MADKELEKFLAATISEIAKGRGALTLQTLGFLVLIAGWVATNKEAQELLNAPRAVIFSLILVGSSIGFHVSLGRTQVDIEAMHDRLKEVDEKWAAALQTLRDGGSLRYSLMVIFAAVALSAVLVVVAMH